jgi:hypothetical protein
MSEKTEGPMGEDPRVSALAQWMRDREEGSSGWCNTTPSHQTFLLEEATDALTAVDLVDPVRLSILRNFDQRTGCEVR